MRLKEIREGKGLSQRDLAAMIGVDASTIHRAEKMAPTAKLSTYKLCAEALDVTLEDIFADDRTAVEDALIRHFRRSTPQSQETFLEVAKTILKASE